jgi:nucleotide-binding universal stress UspA family protein
MIRDILVGLNPDSGAPSLDFAISLAGQLGAHLTGLAFAVQPDIPGGFLGAVPAELIVEQREAADTEAAAMAARFSEKARLAGIAAEARSATLPLVEAATAFGRLARVFDLAVLDQPNPDKPGSEIEFIEASLIDSGRGMLIVPYVQKTPLKLDRVLIAWDGSRAASRAIGEAHALIEKAKQVEVLVVQTGRTDPRAIPGAELARHLARHDLKVDLHDVVPASGQSVAGTILNEAFERAADLLVMGGYGHSRLREFVLGGTTREVIESMTVPTLMAH